MAFCGYLKQSTAATIILGPFVDEDDGKTAETALTISQADVRLSKNGGNMAQKNDANAATHDEIGNYSCQIDTTDTNTLGLLDVMVHESGALPIKQTYQVVTAHWWDTMCSTDLLHVDIHAVDDDETAADNLELITEIANITSLTVDADGHLEANVVEIEGADPTDTIRDSVVDDATRIDASALNTLSGHDPASQLAAQTDITGLNDPTAATIADAVWDEASTGHVDAGKAGQQLWTDLDAILTDTGELQPDWHDGGRLDLLIDGIITHLTEVKGATFAEATDSLEAIRDRGDAEWTTGSGDATETKQDTIITHLTDVKGTGFAKDTDSLVDLAHTGADGDTLETLSDQIDDVVTLGAGAIEFTYTLTSSVDSTPVADADIWVTTSNDPDDNIVASGTTDANGEVTFYLDAGTVYVWRQKSGWNFTNPDIEVVS